MRLINTMVQPLGRLGVLNAWILHRIPVCNIFSLRDGWISGERQSQVRDGEKIEVERMRCDGRG